MQGQAVVLASTTLRRQSCCRSEVLTSSRIADLVDTSSGEAHHGGFPGIFPPLLGGPLSEDRGGVQSVRGPYVHNVSPAIKLPVRGSDVLSYCRLSRLCGLFSRLTGTMGHTLFERALVGLPGCVLSYLMVPVQLCLEVLKAHWDNGSHLLQESPRGAFRACPLILNGPSGTVPRGSQGSLGSWVTPLQESPCRAPWVCPLFFSDPSGTLPRGSHMFQAKASVHLDVSESATGD